MTDAARQEWTVPAELAIALAPEWVQRVVDRRRALCDAPLPNALVFIRGGKVFGLLSFKGDQRAQLQVQLRASLWENAG